MSSSSRPPFTARDVIGAGFLMLAINIICAVIGAGIGALFGVAGPLAVAGFLVGFLVAIRVVIKRFNPTI